MLFFRKGMDLYDLEAIVCRRAGDFFLIIVELILIFKDFKQKIFSPLNFFSLLWSSVLPNSIIWTQNLQVPLHSGGGSYACSRIEYLILLLCYHFILWLLAIHNINCIPKVPRLLIGIQKNENSFILPQL